MKILALYLPQYHEIPENNKWWGKGYAEWNAVKNAPSLYYGLKLRTSETSLLSGVA